MKKLIAAIAAVSSLSVISAVATASGTSGFYIGAGVGATNVKGDIPVGGIYVADQYFDDSASSYDLHVGYQFTSWFSLEAAYSNFGSATQHYNLKQGILFIVAPNTEQELSARGESIASVFSYHFSPVLSVSAVAGVTNVKYESTFSGGYLKSQSNITDQGLVLGGGLKYRLSNTLALRTDLRRTNAGDYRLDTFSLGLDYSF